jgi:hypothetical protein
MLVNGAQALIFTKEDIGRVDLWTLEIVLFFLLFFFCSGT